MDISVFIYSGALVGYALFAGLLAFRGARTWTTLFFMISAVMTAVWSASVVGVEWLALPRWYSAIAVPLRDGAWLSLVLAVLYFSGHGRRVWRTLAITTAGVIVVYTALSAAGTSLGTAFGIIIDWRTAGILSAIISLILVENMMRNLSQDQFWAAKYLGIGMLGVVALQFIMRLPEFLTSIPISTSIEPAVYLLILPLFVLSAVRSPSLQLRVHSSRKIVFHTTALIIIGIILEGTALAAYYVRTYGGDEATALSIILGFGGAIAVAIVFASASVRSRLRTFINENFFSYKYDYRLEWQKFIQALSAYEGDDIPLGVLRTLAEVLDSPGGALWVFRERWNQFMPVAHWSLRSELAPISPNDQALAAFEDDNCVFLDLTSAGSDASALIWHQRFPAAWLAVPLRYRTRLVGVVLVNKPRAQRQLDWEDKHLIALVALQLAAYLVQEETAQALADARQLEDFNKRFAFILHDTKNTIGQLSLLVRNAEQFGHDENFRKDMIVTLRHSVEKLQELLIQLKGTGSTIPNVSHKDPSVDLATLVSALVQDQRKLGFNVTMDGGGDTAHLKQNDAKAFLGVIEQIISNAIEASPPDRAVNVRVAMSGSFVEVSVRDSGPGMSQQFINDELFRPLRSTKGTGFGIGAYQARETVRDLGGDITVGSKLGEGTIVTLSLPAFTVEKRVVGA
jgi:putative PEP-CTERM system histidine kinase